MQANRTLVLWVAAGIGLVAMVAGWKGDSILDTLKSSGNGGSTGGGTKQDVSDLTAPGGGVAAGAPGIPSAPSAPVGVGVASAGALAARGVTTQDGIYVVTDEYGNIGHALSGAYQTNPSNYITARERLG